MSLLHSVSACNGGVLHHACCHLWARPCRGFEAADREGCPGEDVEARRLNPAYPWTLPKEFRVENLPALAETLGPPTLSLSFPKRRPPASPESPRLEALARNPPAAVFRIALCASRGSDDWRRPRQQDLDRWSCLTLQLVH